MNIRIATTWDRDAVQKIYRSAFPPGESELVAKIALDLLVEETAPQTISLVAETAGVIVGHIAFSPVRFDNNEACYAYILAPLAVMPQYQTRRIGSELIAHGVQQLSNMGIAVVFVYGDPEYYGRFGFSAAAARQYTTPYELQYPFGWQALVLKECTIREWPVRIACVTALCDPQLW